MIIQERLLKIIRDDNYAAGFQSLGQYRTALLQATLGKVEDAPVDGLLPCPFCGGTDAFIERLDNCSAYVMCSTMVDEHSCCTARGPNGIQEDDGEEIPGAAAAIAAWNQRAAPGVQGELVGEVRFELGAPSFVYGEIYSDAAPRLAPGAKLYVGLQRAEQPAADDELADDAEFLLHRLREMEDLLVDDELCRSYQGHVVPAIARLERLVAAHRKQGGDA